MLSLTFGLVAALCWGLHDFIIRILKQPRGIYASIAAVLFFGCLFQSPVVILYADFSKISYIALSLSVVSGSFFCTCWDSFIQSLCNWANKAGCTDCWRISRFLLNFLWSKWKPTNLYTFWGSNYNSHLYRIRSCFQRRKPGVAIKQKISNFLGNSIKFQLCLKFCSRTVCFEFKRSVCTFAPKSRLCSYSFNFYCQIPNYAYRPGFI